MSERGYMIWCASCALIVGLFWIASRNQQPTSPAGSDDAASITALAASTASVAVFAGP